MTIYASFFVFVALYPTIAVSSVRFIVVRGASAKCQSLPSVLMELIELGLVRAFFVVVIRSKR